jgi:hypothetical protein
VRGRTVAICALLAAAPARVIAAPTADVVILWTSDPAPGLTGAVGDAARRAGAALIDVSPAAREVESAAPWIRQGIDGYGALNYKRAREALDHAAELVDRTGGAGLDVTALGDLFLYRGMVRAQENDEAGAWEDFVVATTIDPTRALDPAGFAPRAVAVHARARAEVATRGRAKVTIAPAGCDVRIDGTPVAGAVAEVTIGRHWLRAECSGRAPVGRRLDVDRPELAVDVAGPPIEPPADAALAIQARTAGARAFIAVTVRGGVATARRLALDGAEQARAAVASAEASLVGDAVTALLTPPAPVEQKKWYQSRWVWAVAGAAVASAILIPIAAQGSGDRRVDIEPVGGPW